MDTEHQRPPFGSNVAEKNAFKLGLYASFPLDHIARLVPTCVSVFLHLAAFSGLGDSDNPGAVQCTSFDSFA